MAFEPKVQADTGAERTLLGTVLMWPESFSQVIDRLDVDDLFAPSHRTIYRVMTELYEGGIPVEPETVAGQLGDRGELESIGGVSYLATLDQNVVGSEVSHYIARIKKKALSRKLAGICGLIESRISEGVEDAEDLLAETQRLVSELAAADEVKQYERADRLLDSYLGQLEDREPGIMTGLADLDYSLGGLQRQDQILVVARPSMGKTALGISIGLNAAKAGRPTALFSLEMSAHQIAGRIAGMWSNVSMHRMRTAHKLERHEWTDLSNVRLMVDRLPFYVDDSSGLTTARLKARARRMTDELGLQLLLIDYIGLLRVGGRSESRNQEVGQISRDVKDLAKELNVPIIAMCQLSRKSEDRKDHEPVLSDLRDSGELEQNADVVIGIHREAYYQETDANRNLATLFVLKHRNGATGKVQVCFLKEYTRFENLGA